ncbi:MAG: hypothetical protein M1825_000497 [Sarcosagium campestre]|nr:MAG: hypothetical protein M1825_000497 [Sarcosagium campestre]
MNHDIRSQTPVTVSLENLKDGNVPFEILESAFGPSSLGIIAVSNLPPQFIPLRQRLLSYSSYLANLPSTELEKLESPAAKWLVGWSCGRETLKSGVFDTLKGSYYVNCAFYKDSNLAGATGDYPSFPEYTAPNVWPAENLLPGFRSTFEELCTLMIDVAVLVARACDRYAESTIEGYKPQCLERMVKSSTTTKARLLHYFPPPSPAPPRNPNRLGVDEEAKEDDGDNDNWCATHLDHGCLTALTSAMFIDETANIPNILNLLRSGQADSESKTVPSQAELIAPLTETDSPDPAAGLYIQSREGSTVKVAIPRDALAFQTGEALELITKGRFKAVPHFVRGTRPRSAGEASKVARNTLAVFTQPDLHEMVDEKRDFATFAKEIVERNH